LDHVTRARTDLLGSCALRGPESGGLVMKALRTVGEFFADVMEIIGGILKTIGELSD